MRLPRGARSSASTRTLDGVRMKETLPFASDTALSGMALNTVTQLNHSILEAFDGV